MGVGNEVSYTQALPSVEHIFLLPVDQDVELSAPPAPRLPACCHAFCHDEMDWISETVSQPNLKKNFFFFKIRVALVMVSLHSNKNQTKTHHNVHFLFPSPGNKGRGDLEIKLN